MKTQRKVSHQMKARPAIDGAGVKLMRAFGNSQPYPLDPFLLLDEFASTNPQDYMAGFPWHPHRGMETVTYMLSGEVEHQDHLRNKGTIKSGDLQWMTAGSGIIHQEMPRRTDGLLRGMQLWVNLPKKDKMTEPKYRDVLHRDVPTEELSLGVEAKVIAGKVGNTKGPVHDIVAEINYIHFSLSPNKDFEFDLKKTHNAFAYILEGEGNFGSAQNSEKGDLVVFSKGDLIAAKSSKSPFEFLMVSGEPLNEPVAWGGPIVMNTETELENAFREINDGTFIKRKPEKEII